MIPEKVIEEKNEDNLSSLKEVSPLTIESKKSVGKSSPAKPPNPAYESLPAEPKPEN